MLKAIFVNGLKDIEEQEKELKDMCGYLNVTIWDSNSGEVEIRIDLGNLDEKQLRAVREYYQLDEFDTRNYDYVIIF